MAIVKTTTAWKKFQNYKSIQQLDSGTASWTQPNLADDNDVGYAVATLTDQPSEYLFGWDVDTPNSELPANAIITGVELSVQCFATGGDAKLVNAVICKTSDNGDTFTLELGDPKTFSDDIPATEVTRFYGGDGDFWGNLSSSWNRFTLVNNGDTLGAAVFFDNEDKNATNISVDYLNIRFHYEYDDENADVLPWEGRKTIIENSSNVSRSLDIPFQPNATNDTFCRYTIRATSFLDLANQVSAASVTLAMGPSPTSMQEYDLQTFEPLLDLGLLSISVVQTTNLDFAIICPAGHYIELRSEAGPASSLNYISGVEQIICVHDVYSIQWSTDVRDPATAPVTTSHRHIAELDVADELTIDQYKRESNESYRNLDNPSGIPYEGIGYVRDASTVHLTGQRTDSDNGLVIQWLGVQYTESSPELTFPTSTTWQFIGPVSTHGTTERFDISSLGGAIPKYCDIMFDTVAPTVSLAFSGMSVGTDAGAPMYRGEYARWVPTYSDGDAGILSATYQYSNGSHWTGEPTNATSSGNNESYIRSSSSAPTSGTSSITLRVEDRAGNVSTDTIDAHFTALPAASTITLSSIDTANERPAHLNNADYGQTAYDDNSISATFTISPQLEDCRNSGNDDTRGGIVDGSLKVTESYVNDVANQASFSDTVSIPNQSSGIGLNVKGQMRDQHYRTIETSPYGDYAFNQGRSNDFNGTDSSAGVPSLPFTGKAGQPYTDEFAEDAATNAQTVGGQVVWTAATGSHETTVALAGNNGERFRPRLFSSSGAEYLYATYSNDLSVEIFDGSNWVSPSAESFGVNADHVIPALNSAGSIQVRINSLTNSAPDVSVLIINYIA